jgi:site-specific DNA recombinase
LYRDAAVQQQHAHGALTLNISLSFAQFEREIISERTRDKIAAARRKGKWLGGYPVLGYDVDPTRRLVVNEAEAEQVREIFTLFLRYRSLIRVLEDIQQRGWRMKSWTRPTGEQHVGRSFDRHGLVRLLSNVLYMGQVNYKGKVYASEQPAIVERTVWQKANRGLQSQWWGSEGRQRNRQGALLLGLVPLRRLLCRRAGCSRRRISSGVSTQLVTKMRNV